MCFKYSWYFIFGCGVQTQRAIDARDMTLPFELLALSLYLSATPELSREEYSPNSKLTTLSSSHESPDSHDSGNCEQHYCVQFRPY